MSGEAVSGAKGEWKECKFDFEHSELRYWWDIVKTEFIISASKLFSGPLKSSFFLYT